MKTVTFHCETITPMFLAGADEQTPELRPPSIKGAMRFWWRAMNGDLVTKSENGEWDYTRLKYEEAKLFGKANEKPCRSNINIEVIANDIITSSDKINGKKFKVKGHEIDIIDYLAYGTNSYKKELKDITFDRKYIKANQKFEIKISLAMNIDFIENILKPFVLLYRIGGIGSKSRNGFGKFNIE
jgi:CRISPR-associated protein Cmr1